MAEDTKTLLSEAEQANARASILAVGRTCRGALPAEFRDQVNAELALGNTDVARAIDASHRAGCGENLNPIILDGPWDGVAHTQPCPACGNVFTYIAPTFSAEE